MLRTMLTTPLTLAGIALMLLWLLVLLAPAPASAETLFQTAIAYYDPRIDLRTDGVLFHGHGGVSESRRAGLRDWQRFYDDVYLMWFIGSDAGRHYVEGRFDGVQRTDEIEAGPSGDLFQVDNRPYMIPTDTWNRYMQQLASDGIAAGATGIAPEEPLLHTQAGYSPAFRQAWEAFYGEPWRFPQGSRQAFWQASKLKSHLYLNAVETLLRYSKDEAARAGHNLRFILPIHSLVSHAAGNMIFPNGAAFHLDELDGFIGQVWTGPIGWSLGKYEGRQLTRDDGFFESAWVLYSSFANLVKGSDKQMYLLADPVEDDPRYRWDQYHLWYNQSLVSKLMFPWITDFEVMPWPDRIFLPGYSTGGGSPGPADYRTQLMVNIAALADMKHQTDVSWDGGTEGIGVIIGDTITWQRGGPWGSSMDSLNGLVLPLLRKGLPVQIVPVERIGDAGYLDEYKVLLLSYDLWKPLDPAYHDALAAWVQQGGTLLFFEGNDRFNTVDEWWRQAGYTAPVEHLLERLGHPAALVPPEIVARQPSVPWSPLLAADANYRNLENLGWYTVDLTPFLPVDAVHIRLRDGSVTDGWGPWLSHVRIRSQGADGTETVTEFPTNGGPGEATYLVSAVGPGGVDENRRFADATGIITYEIPTAGSSRVEVDLHVGNHFMVDARPVQPAVEAPDPFAGFEEPVRTAFADLLAAAAVRPSGLGPLTPVRFRSSADGPTVDAPSAEPGGASHSEATESPSAASQPEAAAGAGTALHPQVGANPDAPRTAFARPVGGGHVVYVGVAPAVFAGSPGAADALRNLVRHAVDTWTDATYQESGYMVLRRGDYVVARGLEGGTTLPGTFVDLLDHRLPIVTDVRIAPGDSALLFDASDRLTAAQPTAVYASHELLDAFNQESRTFAISAGPWQTPGVIRIAGGSERDRAVAPASVQAYAIRGMGQRLERSEVDRAAFHQAWSDGQMAPVATEWTHDPASGSVWVQFDQWHSGVWIAVTWE